MLDQMKNDLINALRDMDAQQQENVEEIAWYYWRETIEDILEIPRGMLDSGSGNDVQS